MVLDSIRVQNFHNLTVAWLKMSLFVELIRAHLYILIIKNKDILILGKGPTFHKWEICLSLYYNRSNSFLFVNATKINQFKAKIF